MIIVLVYPVIILVLLRCSSSYHRSCARILRYKLVKYGLQVVNLVFLGVAELLVSPWGVLRLHQAIQHLYELAVTILLHFHTFKRVF